MKKFVVAILTIAMTLALCACGGSSESSDVNYSEIKVDKKAGTVTVYAKLNSMYIDQSTMHFVVYKGGNVAEKSMLVAYADSQDFYDALVEAGGKPGNETTDKIVAGEYVTGQPLEITLKWDGQDEPVAYKDFVVRGDGKPVEEKFLFGGNKRNNEEAASGCLACNNSCWAGITSNASMPFDEIDSGKANVFLNGDVVPKDGTVCEVTFTLK